jgi:hypothetical protein
MDQAPLVVKRIHRRVKLYLPKRKHVKCLLRTRQPEAPAARTKYTSFDLGQGTILNDSIFTILGYRFGSEIYKPQSACLFYACWVRNSPGDSPRGIVLMVVSIYHVVVFI